jgi:hypothetical protein
MSVVGIDGLKEGLEHLNQTLQHSSLTVKAKGDDKKNATPEVRVASFFLSFFQPLFGLSIPFYKAFHCLLFF